MRDLSKSFWSNTRVTSRCAMLNRRPPKARAIEFSCETSRCTGLGNSLFQRGSLHYSLNSERPKRNQELASVRTCSHGCSEYQSTIRVGSLASVSNLLCTVGRSIHDQRGTASTRCPRRCRGKTACSCLTSNMAQNPDWTPSREIQAGGLAWCGSIS